MRKWARLLSIIGTAAFGLGGAYLILSAESASRYLVAVSGVLGLAGAAAAIVLLCFLYVVIEEDVRPSLRFRKPAVPLSLSNSLPSMIGRRSFRNHPVRFWGVLTLNTRFLFGFMLLDPPEHLELYEEQPEQPA